MATKSIVDKLDETEKQKVKAGFDQIRSVLESHNIKVADIIGLVTTDDVASARKQIDIRFAEVAGPKMNMVAFD